MISAVSIGPALTTGSAVALPLAFVGGLIAGVNPCCLALYPAAVGVCCSCSPSRDRPTFSVRNAAAFVLGLAIAVTALGLLAVMIGRIAGVITPIRYLIACIPIVVGFVRLGWIELPQLLPKAPAPGFGGAFGAGLLLSLIIGPCGTPVLAAVLSYAALQQNFAYGGLLLMLYGIGTVLPLIAVGAASDTLLRRLASKDIARWVDPTMGALLIVLGLYLIWRA